MVWPSSSSRCCESRNLFFLLLVRFFLSVRLALACTSEGFDEDETEEDLGFDAAGEDEDEEEEADVDLDLAAIVAVIREIAGLGGELCWTVQWVLARSSCGCFVRACSTVILVVMRRLVVMVYGRTASILFFLPEP